VTREDHHAKARRYLDEARLTVTTAQHDLVLATCRGSGATYRCGHSPIHGWWCNCPAKSECAHVAALKLVTVIPETSTNTKRRGAR
jgi:hypothetical protein